jgi:hypothetical protein
MPTVFVAGVAVNLPRRFSEGDVLTETTAWVLTNVQHNRLTARLRALLTNGHILPAELQARAELLSQEELTPYSVLDLEEDDPVMAEALSIAKEVINAKLASEGLDVPKNINDHAKALVEAVPAIQEQARLRVEARYQAGATLLGETL